MDEEKIEWVKKELGGRTVQELAEFDVKKGQDGEDGAPYYKTYLDQTAASMGALFKKTEWGDLTPWEKLCCYKISGSTGVDCDASLRSTVIYQLVFRYGGSPEQYKQHRKKGEEKVEWDYCLKWDGPTLRGDTMNSYATTVHEYIHSVLGSNSFDEMKEKNIVTGKSKRGRLYAAGQYCRSGSDNAHWERAILHHYDYFKTTLLEKFENSEKFFELYHTVGNFLPAPRGFQSRGGKPCCDYWDLALMCIYHYYSGIKYPLSWLVNADSIPVCHQWLDSFGTWNGFVEQNFLQDFIGPDGIPKELWKGHFTNGAMPKKEADFEQFFTNASAWITARGVHIALAVREALAAEKSAEAREVHP